MENNLKNVSAEELYVLMAPYQQELDRRRAIEDKKLEQESTKYIKEKLAEAIAKDKVLNPLKKEFKNLLKEVGKKRSDKFTLQLTIDFDFKYSCKVDHDNEFVDIYDDTFGFNAKLRKDGLTKEQYSILSDIVCDFADSACKDAVGLSPTSDLNKLDKLYQNLLKKAKKLGYSSYDVEDDLDAFQNQIKADYG